MLRLRLRIGLDPLRGLPAPKPLTRFGSPSPVSQDKPVAFGPAGVCIRPQKRERVTVKGEGCFATF